MHKVEKCLDGPLLPKKTLRGKGEPRLVKEKNTPVPRLLPSGLHSVFVSLYPGFRSCFFCSVLFIYWTRLFRESEN
jgi:hypothetical protein